MILKQCHQIVNTAMMFNLFNHDTGFYYIQLALIQYPVPNTGCPCTGVTLCFFWNLGKCSISTFARDFFGLYGGKSGRDD